MNKRTGIFFTAALGAALFTSLPGLAADGAAPANTNVSARTNVNIAELFGDSDVAKGKGVEVKRSQLDSALINIKATAAARGQALPPEHMAMVERQLLDGLIQVQLLLSKATDADKAAGKEASDKRFVAITNRAGSEENLNRQLKSVSMTKDEFRSKMTDEAIATAVVERELKVNVTDADAKKFYDDNPAKFEQPEMVRASHILLSTLDPVTRAPLTDEQKQAKHKQMEDILKRAKAGEDFAKLAKEYSEDPGSKDRGGEYKFPRGQMVPEFESAAFTLNTNQISDIVTTQFGYHIIKLSEKIPAQKTEYAKATDDIKEYLKQQELQKQLPDYLEKLKKEAAVEILDEKLKAAAEPELPPLLPAKTGKAATKSADKPAEKPAEKP